MTKPTYIERQTAMHLAQTRRDENLLPRHLLDERITMTTFDPPPRPVQNYGAPTVQDQLFMSGEGQIAAEAASAFAFSVPRSADADQYGIQVFVRAIQMQLGIPQTGYMDKRTMAAMESVSGPDWFDKTWTALLGDATTRKGPTRSGDLVTIDMLPGLADVEASNNRKASLVVLGAVLLTAWVMLK